MKLRAPATPLITIDPYFSVWSTSDRLYDNMTRHWTGKPNEIIGTVAVDGEEFRFMGIKKDVTEIPQISVDIDALSTTYVFANDKIELTASFMSPLFPDDLMLMSKPVSYLKTTVKNLDGQDHEVIVKIAVSEEICLDLRNQYPVELENTEIAGLRTVKMGSTIQEVLNRSGDDLRIDWGYFYLTVAGEDAEATFIGSEVKERTERFRRGREEVEEKHNITYACAGAKGDALFIFAYDDIMSIEYFGKQLPGYWKKDGKTIETAITEAYNDYDKLAKKAKIFGKKLFNEATVAGGEKYAEMLSLAFRQAIAAHKLAADENGDALFISKECFSNGCAATVDVSYPSIPMFLLYNPELVLGMMRPIFKYADSEVWPFDFAPHDAGQYPLLNGQVYSNGTDPRWQMPVEECGNMLVMAAAASVAAGDASFAKEHYTDLENWAQYLIKYGVDPEHQLCTDDFAGHLAHNCNLSLKAVAGLLGFAIINYMLGDNAAYDKYTAEAEKIAKSWEVNAANGDGSYRLAYDRPGTFSMKYNAVWDKLFGTDIISKTALSSELFTNFKQIRPYGMPLDNRADYTKADWLVWTATLLSDKGDFERFVEPLWMAYNYTKSRVPMTDWYDTVTSNQVGFQNRTVIGGLFIKLLEQDGKMMNWKE